MAQDHSFFVSSTYAVKIGSGNSDIPLPSDEDGYIAVAAGDKLRFKHYKLNSNVALNEQIIHAKDKEVRLSINDNDRYVWSVPAGETIGISCMEIYTITVLNPCTFRYEGLAA